MRGPKTLRHNQPKRLDPAPPPAPRRILARVLGLAMIGLAGCLAAAAPAVAIPTAPTVAGVAPAEGPTEGGSEVVITGTGFHECAVAPSSGPDAGQLLPRACEQNLVRFGGEPGLVVAATATEIDVFSPPHAPGTVDVTVTTPGGQSATGAADQFTFMGSAPTMVSGPLPQVTSIVPDQGPTAGFNEITIHGKNLLPPEVTHCVGCSGVVVEFGGSAVPVLEGTEEEIGVIAPPHAAGTVAVTVTTPTGTSETSGYGLGPLYTYLGEEVVPPPPPHRHHHHHHHHHQRFHHGRGHDHGRGHSHGGRYGPRHFDSSRPGR